MDLDPRVCSRARRARDARFDGRFFIGVTSTGIYCRPICPARSPKEEHVRYFVTALAAEAAGFRPCLRCRPEASPGTPAWFGTSGIVSRALRIIAEGGLRCEPREAGVERLAARVGVTARHLRRLFLQHLGTTPLDVALVRRAHCAKRLVDETSLPFHHVALAAGFGSVRRFNADIRRTYARTPTQLRRLARQRAAADPDCYSFRLAYRPPYDWDAALGFLAARATPGVESVDGARYRRTIAIGEQHGSIEVSHLAPRSALVLNVRFPDPALLLVIVERVRGMFDVGADPAIITEQLRADRLLRGPLARHPGIRTPGAWDGFELGVRAILGQQISVHAATTLAGRVAAMFGSPCANGATCHRLFPTPAQLADATLEQAGLVRARAETIRTLARRTIDGTVAFDSSVDPLAAVAVLKAISGIGDWTAQYIAMRALGEPDAFPCGDLVLRRMAGDCTTAELERRSQAWRPWRAYAVMLLWQAAGERPPNSSRSALTKGSLRSCTTTTDDALQPTT
jgi:AraC family transcriptional regulator, regulatory protein of adaptative response / DNA-3-methyladenine glycosylase II